MSVKKTILILSGSLRDNSSTGAVIRKVREMMGDTVEIMEYKATGQLPHFDDKKEAPELVQHFRKQIEAAAGVLICTPEYAFGIPGTLKNALDWTVGSGSFNDKPTALITAASQGQKGHAALLDVLTAINARLNDATNLLISFIRSKITSSGELQDEHTLTAIQKLIAAFLEILDHPFE